MDDIIIEVVAKRPSFVVNLEVTNTKAEISQIIANMFKGDKGDKGERGLQGERGVGIESIIKSFSNGLVDTYVINFSDGTTTTYQITNGKDGKDGFNGKDGKSAYEFAKDGGYIGTNQDFSTDLAKVKYAVVNTTTINDKPLSSNINLTANDVGALPNTTIIPSDYVSYKNEQKLTEYQKQQARKNIGALSSDITIPEGVKLYDGVGQNTDGAITQKGTSDAITNLSTYLEDKITENILAIEGINNELSGTKSSLQSTQNNLSNLQVNVNTNIQDIATLRNDFTNESVYCNTNIETLNDNVNFLTTNKANKDLSNVTYPENTAGSTTTGSGDRVIETYISSDKNTWYRKWASGFKECGQTLAVNSNIGAGSTKQIRVTLPIYIENILFGVCNTKINTAGTSDSSLFFNIGEYTIENNTTIANVWGKNVATSTVAKNVIMSYYCCGY